MGTEDAETRSLATRIGEERFAAEHPSWRLFHAHPAIGLLESETAFGLEPRDLGVAWLALAVAERRAREHDFLRALLERAALATGARFEAGWQRDPARTAQLARRCGGAFSDDGTVCGALSEKRSRRCSIRFRSCWRSRAPNWR